MILFFKNILILLYIWQITTINNNVKRRNKRMNNQYISIIIINNRFFFSLNWFTVLLYSEIVKTNASMCKKHFIPLSVLRVKGSLIKWSKVTRLNRKWVVRWLMGEGKMKRYYKSLSFWTFLDFFLKSWFSVKYCG